MTLKPWQIKAIEEYASGVEIAISKEYKVDPANRGVWTPTYAIYEAYLRNRLPNQAGEDIRLPKQTISWILGTLMGLEMRKRRCRTLKYPVPGYMGVGYGPESRFVSVETDTFVEEERPLVVSKPWVVEYMRGERASRRRYARESNARSRLKRFAEKWYMHRDFVLNENSVSATIMGVSHVVRVYSDPDGAIEWLNNV